MTATTRTLDNGIYKAALVHAFVHKTDDFEDMNYDIIARELKSSQLYYDFLDSVEYMNIIFQCGVVRWSFDEFNTGIVNNKDVPTWLFKCWKTYMEIHNKPGWENVYMEVLHYMETI